MAMMWSDDPIRDAERYQQYLEELEDYEKNCLHCVVDDDLDWCENCMEVKNVNTV